MQCCVLLPESSFLTLKDGLCSPPEMDPSRFCETSQHLVKWAILHFPDCKTQMKEMVTVSSLSVFGSHLGREGGRATLISAPYIDFVAGATETRVENLQCGAQCPFCTSDHRLPMSGKSVRLSAAALRAGAGPSVMFKSFEILLNHF